MSVSELILSIAMIVFLIVASDGRLATGTCILMVLLAPFLKRFDQRFAFLLFFGVTRWMVHSSAEWYSYI